MVLRAVVTTMTSSITMSEEIAESASTQRWREVERVCVAFIPLTTRPATQIHRSVVPYLCVECKVGSDHGSQMRVRLSSLTEIRRRRCAAAPDLPVRAGDRSGALVAFNRLTS